MSSRTDPDRGSSVSPDRSAVLAAAGRVACALVTSGVSLAEAIDIRSLYLRVSITGRCNLACDFCYNEGGTREGSLAVTDVMEILREARSLGFTRLQLTGGEPLLHPDAVGFVAAARTLFEDVGITTNGTHILSTLPALIEAGVSQVHASLTPVGTAHDPPPAMIAIPPWLEEVSAMVRGRCCLRLNIPVVGPLSQVSQLLRSLSGTQCDAKLLAPLPSAVSRCLSGSELCVLRRVADEENERRVLAGTPGRVSVREYLLPRGTRCQGCASSTVCREGSRSLRLGADLVLRPCLVSRAWDLRNEGLTTSEWVRAAALLALDYQPTPKRETHHA